MEDHLDLEDEVILNLTWTSCSSFPSNIVLIERRYSPSRLSSERGKRELSVLQTERTSEKHARTVGELVEEADGRTSWPEVNVAGWRRGMATGYP